MNAIIENSVASGSVKAIPSKSYAHRVLICDLLSGKEVRKEFDGFTSKDILATANCLQNLKDGKTVLDAGESGSTLRFLLVLLSALGGEYTVLGHGKLMERPNEELINALELHGMQITSGEKITLTGKLKSGEFRLKGDISSQYISGLLMALPLLDGDSQIVLTTPLSSKAYVDITLQVLSGYGIKIDKTPNGYKVYGNQTYNGGYQVEGDWSNMAFFLVLGALSEKGITVKGLNLKSIQSDKNIMAILALFGADINIYKDEITVKKDKTRPFSVCMDECPDLVPIVAVLGAFAQGNTVIKEVQRLRLKESDRITSTIQMLNAFGIKATSDGKTIEIIGGTPTGGTVSSFNDHRIVMASAVMGLIASGTTTILDSQAVTKSYPTFFEDYSSVGGKVSES